MNNQRMIALAEATAEHLAAKRKEHQKNQCPTCGQDMREEPREDLRQCCGHQTSQSRPRSERPAVNAQLVELGPNLIARLNAVDPGESVPAQILTLIEQRNALFDACSTALDALDGFDPLMDDESRSTAYADELKTGFAAKDQLRSAMAKYLNR